MKKNNQNNSLNELYISLDAYHVNSQGTKSFNGTNLFIQENNKESQGN